MDDDSKLFDAMMEEVGRLPPPALPEMRMFVVRRANPVRDSSFSSGIEEIYIAAHYLQYSGSVLMLQQYVIDPVLNRAVERTVRAFNSWLDVEAIPLPVKSALAH